MFAAVRNPFPNKIDLTTYLAEPKQDYALDRSVTFGQDQNREVSEEHYTAIQVVVPSFFPVLDVHLANLATSVLWRAPVRITR